MPVVVCLFMDEYVFYKNLDINVVAMRKHWMPETTDKMCIVCLDEDPDRSMSCEKCGARTCQKCMPGMGKMVVERQQSIRSHKESVPIAATAEVCLVKWCSGRDIEILRFLGICSVYVVAACGIASSSQLYGTRRSSGSHTSSSLIVLGVLLCIRYCRQN